MEQDEIPNISEEEKEKKTQAKVSVQNTNRIMGLAAIFISLLSLFAVVYQSYLAREENEMMHIQQSASVLPYLDFWYSNVGEEYRVVIENKGLGPAFIKDVKFIGLEIKNKDSLSFNNSHDLFDFVIQHSAFVDSIPATRSSFNANMLLAPNETKEFFTFSFANNKQKIGFRDEFYKYYAGFKIVYADVYGSSWMLDSEKGYPVKLD